ncbi:hypothetical protein PISMIDRAFT_497888 [Pisolithus microcarpus 441]|uniref:Uncharacterized protein n=1 Tax=Pisolithus microcarpus 441 TaxID=765257 RepID=A0A0C9Z971_9AGAM|nr:hypothetical protein PISMIDRAFT_497888 [Pisolithus microcarpus 441]
MSNSEKAYFDIHNVQMHATFRICPLVGLFPSGTRKPGWVPCQKFTSPHRFLWPLEFMALVTWPCHSYALNIPSVVLLFASRSLIMSLISHMEAAKSNRNISVPIPWEGLFPYEMVAAPLFPCTT